MWDPNLATTRAETVCDSGVTDDGRQLNFSRIQDGHVEHLLHPEIEHFWQKSDRLIL